MLSSNANIYQSAMAKMHLWKLRTTRYLGLNTSSKRKKCVYIAVGLIIVWLFRAFYVSEFKDVDLAEIDGYDDDEISKESRIMTNKWVVITTIHSPSRILNTVGQVPGWQVLVVGDTKTPTPWNLPGVIFLGIKEQKSLHYAVMKHLPFSRYCRKVIGYLYAMQHGAQFIYETDDDNFPVDGINGFKASLDRTGHLVLETSNLTCNPYVHFGQSTIWPRGYPLDRIGLPPDRMYNLCLVNPPAIQEGVVNGDPDVDALLRLTRRRAAIPLNLTFDKSAPPFMLPTGTFAPFNSQNTFFTIKAFWAMILPTMVSDRVTDIYRSYWAQRLLWLIGENIAFAPPNAVQKRSGHLDLIDAKAETDLYHNIGNYIEKLNKWRCDHNKFFKCVSQLSHDLVIEGLWKDEDAKLVDAWLSDLIHIKYQVPEMIVEKTPTCLNSESNHVVFYPVEQNTSMPHTASLVIPPETTNHDLIANKIITWCGHAHHSYWKTSLHKGQTFSDILLVISLYQDPVVVIPFLEAFYKINFPHILYCTDQILNPIFIRKWKVSIVTLQKDRVAAVPCLIAAGQMHYGMKGILHITDMMWIKTEVRLTEKQAHLMWMTSEFDAYKVTTINLCSGNTVHCHFMTVDDIINVARHIEELKYIPNKRKTKLLACLHKLEKDPTWFAQKELIWITDLAVYLPVKILPDLGFLQQLFVDKDYLSYEFMVLLFLECDQLTIDYLKHSEEMESADNTADYVFPVMFSKISKDKTLTKHFCNKFQNYA